MLFSKRDIECLISALDVFVQSDFGILNKNAKCRTADSILEKFESYSVLTVFTKQEYTVMGMACECCIANAERAYKDKRINYSTYISDKTELQNLSDRIFPLAKPDLPR